MGLSFCGELDNSGYADRLFQRSRDSRSSLGGDYGTRSWSKGLFEILEPFSNVLMISFEFDFEVSSANSEPKFLL